VVVIVEVSILAPLGQPRPRPGVALQSAGAGQKLIDFCPCRSNSGAGPGPHYCVQVHGCQVKLATKQGWEEVNGKEPRSKKVGLSWFCWLGHSGHNRSRQPALSHSAMGTSPYQD
jgi:hypothetical protein